MKINTSSDHFLIKKSDFKDLFNIMKICLFLLFAFAFQMMATNTEAQDAIINLKSNTVNVRKLISEIEKQTDYLVVYSNREVNTSREVTLKKKSDKVSEYLYQTFNGTDIGYEFENNYIVLSRKAQETASILTGLTQTAQQLGKTVKGSVTDSNGEPIIGATIVLKGDAAKGTVTGVDGNYILLDLPEDAELEISFVGMQSQSIF
ncbi:MAG: carboxypeptidase-like regulatory domain-containing protein, partial [Candidatus Paceibacterota bacterium]